MEKPQYMIRINPYKIFLVLCGISLTILIFSLLGQLPYEARSSTDKFFRDLFTVEFFVNNGENIATYWNMFLLTGLSVLTFGIASIKQAQKDKYRFSWWALGVIFLSFAIDTLAGVSHRMFTLLQDLPTLEGGFLFNWLYAAAAVIIILLILFFIWFLLHLDAGRKYLFPISLILYTLGAYKVELFSARYADLYGATSRAYLWLTHTAEFAEYLGIALMIYLLLTYLAKLTSEVEVIS
jgi:hypothetical protein